MSRPPQPPSPPSKPARHRAGYATAAAAVLLAAYALSGFYFVQPDQRGVERWFGVTPRSQMRPPYGVGPGLHYALPWPLCRVDRPKTTEMRHVVVGLTPELRAAIDRGEAWALRYSPATDVFTGDVNILKVTMIAIYQVTDPTAYLFGTENPDELVRLTVQSTLIKEMAKLPVDAALTSAKALLENETRAQAQQRLDLYHCGVQLVATNLDSLDPPRAIDTAFKDVVSAKKDGEREIDRAVAETNRILPRARGDAAKLLEEAESYHQERVRRAQGEAASFLSVLAEYQLSPRVTADRLRLQTFEKILAKVRKVIVDDKTGEPPTRVRIIDKAPK
jgi:modulator of FtsH protease HflK